MIEKINYEKILVPLDGSSKSFESFSYALRFSQAFEGSKITLLHVVNEEQVKQMRLKGDSSYTNVGEVMQNQGIKYLNKALNEAKMQGFNVNTIETKLLKGNVVEEIIKYAENFDLIIMTARGKKHVVEYLMGHVALRVINLVNIPVLIVS
ncbi:MAG: universal stress protein [Candidatus Lokiarchaeota archaeon]